jgi:hypothetical protein
LEHAHREEIKARHRAEQEVSDAHLRIKEQRKRADDAGHQIAQLTQQRDQLSDAAIRFGEVALGLEVRATTATAWAQYYSSQAEEAQLAHAATWDRAQAIIGDQLAEIDTLRASTLTAEEAAANANKSLNWITDWWRLAEAKARDLGPPGRVLSEISKSVQKALSGDVWDISPPPDTRPTWRTDAQFGSGGSEISVIEMIHNIAFATHEQNHKIEAQRKTITCLTTENASLTTRTAAAEAEVNSLREAGRVAARASVESWTWRGSRAARPPWRSRRFRCAA